MNIRFAKYQGTGNDFIMLDNMDGQYNDLSIEQIQFLCDRKLGVGADGLIKLSAHDQYDFEVEYYNADGTQSFCGNGARCSTAFAKALGLIEEEALFMAIDGRHEASVGEVVHLEMNDVTLIEKQAEDFILDTGSPHYVRLLNNGETLDIVEYGKKIRYSEQFKEQGINVNTVRMIDTDSIYVETYERGVENETLSCGTGVTACALVVMSLNPSVNKVKVKTKGGELTVSADAVNNGYKNIWLSGPAKKVFDGSIDV